MSKKDDDLLEGLNLIDDDELAEEVPGDEVDEMGDIVDLLDDDADDDVVESESLEVSTDGSETAENPPVAEVQPEAAAEAPLEEKPKKKRNKPRKKAETNEAVETKVVLASEPADKAAGDLYENATVSIGTVVLDAGILRIRAAKVIIEAGKIEFNN